MRGPRPKVRAGRPFRLAVLNSHPIQYFAPLYRYLSKDPALDITVLYLSDASLRGGQDPGFGQSVTWDVDLLDGYSSRFLGKAAKTRTPAGFFSLTAPEIWSEIRNGGYDAVLVHGHQYAANFLAIAAAKLSGTRVWVKGETHLGLERAGGRRLLRRPVMAAFHGLVDRAMAIGSANAEYYRAMGVPEQKIYVAPYSVDNARFIADSSLSAADRRIWRAHFDIPGDGPAILYAAKFTRRKRPDDLLQAALRIRGSGAPPFTVVMCGSGEMDAELRAFCLSNGLDNVVFTGFVNQANLPKLYGACDVFVLPSGNEPWGLAVNEAMCASLPIVVSREVGCVPDLVTEGVNGFTPDAGDIDALTSALRQLVENAELREAQGKASRERISSWSYRECLEAFHGALLDTAAQ